MPPRAKAPRVNCPVAPPPLIRTELFGFVMAMFCYSLAPERFSKRERYTFDPEGSWNEEMPMLPETLTKKE